MLNQVGMGGAGYVNPHVMVKGQLGHVGKHGAHIVSEMAVEIEATNDDVVATMNGGNLSLKWNFSFALMLIQTYFLQRRSCLYKHILSLLCLKIGET